MADGRWQMADGRWQMADGRWGVALLLPDYAGGRLVNELAGKTGVATGGKEDILVQVLGEGAEDRMGVAVLVFFRQETVVEAVNGAADGLGGFLRAFLGA
jgi:hypothetical protein